MKLILIAAVLAIVAFFVAKKLKAKKEEAKPVVKAAPNKKAPAKKKTKTVKPAGGASLSESDSNGD